MGTWVTCCVIRTQAGGHTSLLGFSGSQLEEFLNQSSPFYFWMNGDRIDSLMESDRQQSQALDAMQDGFTRASGIMDTLFQDRFFTHQPQDSHYLSPFGFPSHRRPHFLYPKSRLVRSLLPVSHFGPLSFHDVFQPFFDMIHEAQQAMDIQFHSPAFQFPDMDFLRGQKKLAGFPSRNGNLPDVKALPGLGMHHVYVPRSPLGWHSLHLQGKGARTGVKECRRHSGV